MGKSQELYEKAKKLIPGGTQLLSKRPEMFLPGLWPSYYSKASGCQVWDLDGKSYHDLSYMGIGSCILGYADQDVDNAAIEAIKRGVMCTLNVPEEVELAELLIKLNPWAEMVRYTRTGGESMAVAVRIARSYSGKDKILFCGYHGWSDWYLSSNLAEKDSLNGHLLSGLSPAGIPYALQGSSYPFHYNNVEQFLQLVEKHKADLGVIVLESIRNFQPTPEFIKALRDVATTLDVPLVVDEISAGFRNTIGGAHKLIGIEPDIAVYAKAMSNGYPMAAIIGKGKVMDAAQKSFISSTYWTDRVGPAAALATINKIIKHNVPAHLEVMGNRIKAGWQKLSAEHGVKIKVYGLPALCGFSFDYPNPLELKTLYTQEMLEKGFLATTGYYAAFAHTQEIVDKYLQAAGETFKKISQVINTNTVMASLKGPVCHSGFQRLA